MLLCCDYDGTLTPIRGRPQEARLEPTTRRLLERLRDHSRFSIGIVSGRRLTELRRLVNLDGIYYVGNHGLEIAGPGLAFVHPGAARYRPTLRRLVAAFRRAARRVPGVVIEDKRLTLSIHYRLTPPDRAARLLERLRRIAAADQRAGRVVIRGGKEVFEVRLPIPWDKGSASLWLRHHIGALQERPRLFTLYLGDDHTDEDAFRAVRRVGGVGIHVGEGRRPTAAPLRLPRPEVAIRWLARLARLPAPPVATT